MLVYSVNASQHFAGHMWFNLLQTPVVRSSWEVLWNQKFRGTVYYCSLHWVSELYLTSPSTHGRSFLSRNYWLCWCWQPYDNKKGHKIYLSKICLNVYLEYDLIIIIIIMYVSVSFSFCFFLHSDCNLCFILHVLAKLHILQEKLSELWFFVNLCICQLYCKTFENKIILLFWL